MKLLFITQKIDMEDDDLAFTILWIQEFIRQGFEVSVVCLEKGDYDGSFKVFSLGKEKKASFLSRVIRFYRYIFCLKYDAVFVHMNPEYITLGGLFWLLKRKPIYLWYTHYTDHIHLRISSFFAKYMFAATEQSLPQYNNNSKKIVTRHGIDTNFWKNELESTKLISENNLLAVHRLSRSKRVEIAISALKFLPSDYTLSIYGRAIDPVYFNELKNLVESLDLSNRVKFYGPVPMYELRDIYPNHCLMLNFASETIDKTMLEAMMFGVFPVTTSRNLTAIGIDVAPQGETPEDVAEFILSKNWKRLSPSKLQRIVEEKHSLFALVKIISKYIRNEKNI